MTDTPEFHDEDEILAAELVLGLLDQEGADLARARMAREVEFARLVTDWQERLVRITDDIRPKQPRAQVKQLIMNRVFPIRKTPILQRVWVWQTVSFAALAMMAFIGWLALQSPVQQQSETLYATQLTGENVPLQVLAVLDPVRGDVAINRVSGTARPGRSLELWAIVPDEAPVSLGVLPTIAKARVALPEALALRASEITLAISDEPAGGSQTGAPTGDVLAASPVSEL